MHSPFFDQESPNREIVGMIASEDRSPSWELDACAVFEVRDGGFLVVHVSGCSCWPDRGTTTQVFCEDRIAVHREITPEWSSLEEACQTAGWKCEAIPS